ncbi:cyclase [Mycobacterium sp. CBMA 234]|uniref:SRPBCC family protein n=1 Tax=Mycolicibacterium sp. CBMA 234 TaxID=1918495 RepID=UPI0012DFD05D|nr:SRPBCC family protein [Mycolicibacterium sp. CBMA 234]MUL63067.1 cyclase [Mycolicibacterium sp. CBMA 234]
MEWTGAVYADAPTVEVSTWIDAPVERVWELASDINVMPECSPELDRVEWTEGCDKPCVGARFVGYSKHPALGEWSTESEIVEYEPQHVMAWAIGDAKYPTATWRLSLSAEGTGTRLAQWAQMGPAPSGLSIAITQMPDKEQKIVFNRLREFEAGMQAALAHIKQRAES